MIFVVTTWHSSFCFVQFYEELVNGTDAVLNTELPDKPPNKKIKFSYSDSEDDGDDDDIDAQKNEGEKDKIDTDGGSEGNDKVLGGDADDVKENDNSHENQEVEAESVPEKKQPDASKPGSGISHKTEDRSIDKLIEAELEELKDKSKVTLLDIIYEMETFFFFF